MRRVVGQVAEEWSVFVGFDKFDGMVGEVVNHKSVAANFLLIVIQRRAEVVPPMARRKAVEFVEASVVRVIGRLSSVVPLSEGPRLVSGRFEYVGNRCFICVQPSLASTDSADSRFGIVATG